MLQIRELRPAFVGILRVPRQPGTPSGTNPLADWQAGRPGALLPARLGGGTIIHIDVALRSIRILTHASLATTSELSVPGSTLLVVLGSAGKTPLPSSVIASDPISQLAILEVIIPEYVDMQALRAMPVAESPDPAPGTCLTLLSDPIGMAKEGSCSSKLTMIKRLASNTQTLSPVLPSTPAIFTRAWFEGWPEPGLTGSPLFDIDQHLIGICTEPDDSAFAGRGVPLICIDQSIQRILDDLQHGWEVDYGFLGLAIQTAGSELLANISKDAVPDSPALTGGVQIDGVPLNSPGALAELHVGDVILRVGSRSVSSPAEFQAAIAAAPPGTIATLRVWRRDTHTFENVAVTTAKLPLQNNSGMIFTAYRFPRWRGLDIGFAAPIVSKSASPELVFLSGVLIQRVQADSPAAKAELKPGDIVTQVGERAVISPAEFHEAIADWTGDTPLTIAGRPAEVYVTDH